MNEAGLGPGGTILYMRSEAVDLWKFLESSDKCMVDGPPGTGKSSIVWAWACYRAYHKKEKILWMHFNPRGDGKFVILNQESKRVSYCSARFYLIFEGLIKKNNVFDALDRVIVDGVTTKHLTVQVGPYADVCKGAVFVSSYSVSLAIQDMPGYESYTMFSWTLDQYKVACANDDFYESVKENLTNESTDCNGESKDDVLKRKYCLAGACARWFFGYDYKAAKVDIEKHLKKVKKFTDCVLKLQGDKSVDAVNHVLCLLNDSDGDSVTVIVSKYATQWLTLKCDFSLIEAFLAQEAVQKNPAFKGWVVELMFLTYIRWAHEYNEKIQVQKDDTVEDWTVHGYTDFDPDNISKPPNREWLIPIKWNQGGYDFVHLKRKDCLLRVVQVTRGQSHPYKLEYVVALMKALREVQVDIKVLDIVMVYPKDTDCPKLEKPERHPLTTIEHDNCFDFKTKERWTAEHIRILSFSCGVAGLDKLQ